jgi:hypothetical protein
VDGKYPNDKRDSSADGAGTLGKGGQTGKGWGDGMFTFSVRSEQRYRPVLPRFSPRLCPYSQDVTLYNSRIPM